MARFPHGSAILGGAAMTDPALNLAIVTGAAGGLGRAFCRRLAAAGRWHVVAIDLDAPALAAAVDEFTRAGGRGEPVVMDVADAGAWVALRARLERDWPRLGLLVNNAGVSMSAEVGEGALDAWRRVLDVNYGGVLAGCHTMAPWLARSAAARAGGPPPAVVNVASILAFVCGPAMAPYSAPKAAVVALSESLHAELRPRGVHVTVAAPGFFPTRLVERGDFAGDVMRREAEQITAASTLSADDVARAVLAASARGELYAVLGRRARWYWRFKRLAPRTLVRAMARRYQALLREAAR
jgi:NAD(P)-dependent dehydrogenase (short-subunit alcohol dehydrogenase family)